MSNEREKHNLAEPPDHIYWRDEALQVMYWMTCEGFGREFTASDLRRFLDAEDKVLEETFENMVSMELLERSGKNSAAGGNGGGRKQSSHS